MKIMDKMNELREALAERDERIMELIGDLENYKAMYRKKTEELNNDLQKSYAYRSLQEENKWLKSVINNIKGELDDAGQI